jgi:hypothetical protein
MYTVECHSDIKKEIMSFAGKWIEPEITTLSKISQAKKSQISPGFTHMMVMIRKR